MIADALLFFAIVILLADGDPVVAASTTASAAIVLSITGMLTAILGPFLVTWISGRQRQQDREDDFARQDLVAKRLKDAQEAIAQTEKANSEKLDKIIVTGAVTHSLVNSNMGTQLKMYAIALRRLAANGNSDDIKAAELAEKTLHEHEENAKKIDAKAANGGTHEK